MSFLDLSAWRIVEGTLGIPTDKVSLLSSGSQRLLIMKDLLALNVEECFDLFNFQAIGFDKTELSLFLIK